MYEQTMQKYRNPEQVEAAIRENFQIGAHKAYAVTRLMKKADFILVSSMDSDLARLLLFTPAKDMEEALKLASDKLGSQLNITLMPMGSLTVPLVEKKTS
jgi:lactate racemase